MQVWNSRSMSALIQVSSPARRRGGAAGDHRGEGAVDVTSNVAGQHRTAQPARQMEAVERQDAALLRVEPVQPVPAAVSAIGNRPAR